MSLRTQLSDILPEILPTNPKEAIKGTELIQVVKARLTGQYSDASLRYHFSIMSVDPASPIAKIEKGQGYYRRTSPVPILSGAQELISYTQGRLDELSLDQGAIDSTLNLMRKFRAVITAYTRNNNLSPFLFRKEFGPDSPRSNLWKFPEVVLIDWQVKQTSHDDEIFLDQDSIQLKKTLGISPYQLTAVRSRLQASYESYLEDFYQTLSASNWAHGGELFYAAPIEDHALIEAFRHLNKVFGIGITTFGLTPAMLEELPRPAHILNAHPREREALMERLDIQRIAPAKYRSRIDWTALNTLLNSSEEIQNLFKWLQQCLQSQKATPYLPE